MVDGMSYLKLYENKACTRELKKDSAGDYVLDIPFLSSNAQTPYQIVIWVMNDGSHRAYDCDVSVVSSDVASTVVSTNISATMFSGEVKRASVRFPIQQGVNGTKRVVLRVNYDSV